jgi:hypothetical protein
MIINSIFIEIGEDKFWKSLKFGILQSQNIADNSTYNIMEAEPYANSAR